MHWFDFSLIKYMPNPKRGEILNIGLVVYRSTGVDVRVLNAPAKARIIDGVANYDHILSIKELYKTITSEVDNTHSQHDIIKAFNGGVFVSEKSAFSIDEIGQYEKKVSLLFNNLVKPFSSREKAEVHSRLHTKLKEKFKAMNILGKDKEQISDHKVIPNYPIEGAPGFYADFMFKNGKYHISEVIDFNVNDVSAKFKETAMKVMTFVEGKKRLGDETGCYFVYSATAKKESEVLQHLNMAEDYSDKAFNLSSRDDELRYFGFMAEMAGNQASLQ